MLGYETHSVCESGHFSVFSHSILRTKSCDIMQIVL